MRVRGEREVGLTAEPRLNYLRSYTGLSGELVMEPGPVELSVGGSSSDSRSSATLTVTGKTRTVSVEDRAFLSTATVGQ